MVAFWFALTTLLFTETQNVPKRDCWASDTPQLAEAEVDSFKNFRSG